MEKRDGRVDGTLILNDFYVLLFLYSLQFWSICELEWAYTLNEHLLCYTAFEYV